MLQRILVPLDGSDLAEGAISSIAGATRRYQGEILILRVVDADPGAGGSLSTLAADLRGDAERYLRGATEKFSSQGLRIRSLIRTGVPIDVILKVVQEEKSTLIAMTTRGRTGLARWTFGHVTKAMLRRASAPLFLHPGVDVSTGSLQNGSMLVPVDCQPESLEILGPVTELAEATGSSLRLLTACAVPEGCTCGETEPSQRQLQTAADRVRSLNIAATTRLAEGDATTAILEESRRPGTSLVAMATHGWRNRSVFRSVTEKVLSAVRIPMLVVRSSHGD